MSNKHNAVITLTLLFLTIIGLYVYNRYYHLSLGIPTKDPFEELNKKPKTMKLPVLMYHYVENVTDENDFIRESLNIPPHIFEKQLVTLKNAGYTFITPKDIKKILEDSSSTEKKYIIITFDDGYEDFYTDVFPILKEQNVKATNYIVYNFIGKLNYMNKEQISTLAKSDSVELGAHTLNHAQLTILKTETAFNEIYQGKLELEQNFNTHVTSFAYPYGAYDKRIKNLVKKAGFTTAVTIEEGSIVSSDNLLEIKRIRPGHLTDNQLLNYIDNQ